MTVPAAAAWIGVPYGTPMSMPGWKPPQRGPNGLVIGPLTGQMSPAALGVAGAEPLPVVLFESPGPASAARILASMAALAAWIDSDSLIASCSCCFVAPRAAVSPAFALASLPLLVSS